MGAKAITGPWARAGGDNRRHRICPAHPLPANRPRRLRRGAFTRNLVRGNHLTPHDFIYPVFVHEGSKLAVPFPPCPACSA